MAKECVGGKEVDQASVTTLVKKFGCVGKERESRVAGGKLKVFYKSLFTYKHRLYSEL